jgi:hypothetical protein
VSKLEVFSRLTALTLAVLTGAANWLVLPRLEAFGMVPGSASGAAGLGLMGAILLVIVIVATSGMLWSSDRLRTAPVRTPRRVAARAARSPLERF